MRRLTLVLCLLSPVAMAADLAEALYPSTPATEPSTGRLPPSTAAPLYQPTPSWFDTTPIRSAPSLPPASYEALDLPPTSRAWQPDNSHLEVRPTVTCYKGASGSVVCH